MRASNKATFAKIVRYKGALIVLYAEPRMDREGECQWLPAWRPLSDAGARPIAKRELYTGCSSPSDAFAIAYECAVDWRERALTAGGPLRSTNEPCRP